MHEFEDDRPIPLGRAAAVKPGVEWEARPVEEVAPPTPAQPEPAEAPVAAPQLELAPAAPAHIKRTRPPAAPDPDVEPASEPAPAIVLPSAPVAEAAPAETPPAPDKVLIADVPSAAAPADHPMAAVGALRFQVEIVGPALPVRDLGRFLAAYVVVAAFVLGLIVAFLALTARV